MNCTGMSSWKCGRILKMVIEAISCIAAFFFGMQCWYFLIVVFCVHVANYLWKFVYSAQEQQDQCFAASIQYQPGDKCFVSTLNIIYCMILCHTGVFLQSQRELIMTLFNCLSFVCVCVCNLGMVGATRSSRQSLWGLGCLYPSTPRKNWGELITIFNLEQRVLLSWTVFPFHFQCFQVLYFFLTVACSSLHCITLLIYFKNLLIIIYFPGECSRASK